MTDKINKFKKILGFPDDIVVEHVDLKLSGYGSDYLDIRIKVTEELLKKLLEKGEESGEKESGNS